LKKQNLKNINTMSTILIQSKDVDSGTSYDGQWNLTSSVIGEFTLKYSYWSTGAIPWINADSATIVVVFNEGIVPAPTLTREDFDATLHYSNSITLDYNALKLESNTTTIAASLQASFQASFDDYADYPAHNRAYTCVVTYDSVNVRYQFTVHHLFNSWGAFCLAFDDPASTASGLFDQETAIFSQGLTNGGSSYVFYLSAQHVGDTAPKFLQMKIDQCESNLVTSCLTTVGSFLLATTDLPYTEQSITFNSYTDVLNISIYRNNISSAPVAATNKWALILQSV
jgi:hypothetical protein